MTAQVGGREIEVDRLAHAGGTGWWLGGITGGGTTLAYSSVDVEYVDPLACGSGGSCKKKIAGGGIDLVTARRRARRRRSPTPALRSASRSSNGRIAYIPATTVAKGGFPASSPTPLVQVRDASSGALVSRAKPVGRPARGRSLIPRPRRALPQRSRHPATDVVRPGDRAQARRDRRPRRYGAALAVSDQFVVYRFGRGLRALVLATRHVRPLGKTAPAYVGLSLDQGRLVWAENHITYGLIRALSIH